MPRNLANRQMRVKQDRKYFVPIANYRCAMIRTHPMRRELRADHLLVENIRTLLAGRGLDDSALAIWCGHKPAWISKILKMERGMPIRELGKVADFFGVTVMQLFSPGISALTERRHSERRSAVDRRDGKDRRKPAELRHPVHRDVDPFPEPRVKQLPASITLRLKPGDIVEPA
jgi:hypothetical protein